MKKYIISNAQHIESDGLAHSITSLFNTKEEAQKILKLQYNKLNNMIKNAEDKYDVYENELTDDSYSINISNIYGFEYYDAFICEIEVK